MNRLLYLLNRQRGTSKSFLDFMKFQDPCNDRSLGHSHFLLKLLSKFVDGFVFFSISADSFAEINKKKWSTLFSWGKLWIYYHEKLLMTQTHQYYELKIFKMDILHLVPITSTMVAWKVNSPCIYRQHMHQFVDAEHTNSLRHTMQQMDMTTQQDIHSEDLCSYL